MIVLKNDYFVFRFASRFFKRNYRFSKKWRVLRVYMNNLHLERPLRTFIEDTPWRHSLKTKLYSEYIFVNHKIVSPLYKTECRLLLVVIQYSPETNPGIVHLSAKTKPIYGEYKYFISCFSSENSYKSKQISISEV